MTAAKVNLQPTHVELDATLRAALQGGSLFIDYTNYRGERAVREIRPVTAPYLGSNEYHPQVQWLVNAVDVERDLERTFALRDVHAWAGTREGLSAAQLS